MKAASILLLALLALGCSKNAPSAAKDRPKIDFPNAEATIERKDSLYEQIHSGMFQADAAVKRIGDALDLARDIQPKATGDLAEEFKDLVATLDDAGASLAEQTGGDPPTEDQVKASAAVFGAKREKLIATVNDILHDMRDQQAAADALGSTGPVAIKASCAKLADVVAEVIDDLLGTLTALGGKDESGQDEPDTGDTNQKPPPGYGTGGTG